MKRGLLLFDLDNVIQSPEEVLAQAGALTRAVAASLRLDALVVAIGMNSVTASHIQDEAFFARLATALAAPLKVAPEAVRIELALTLVMPEAVDLALTRLVREAPDEQGAGAYEALLLASEDQGLRRAAGEAVGARLTKGKSKDALFWVSRHFERSLGAGDPPSTSELPKAPSGDLTRRLDDPARCAWGASVEPQGPRPLSRLAEELESSPWWLTQLGATSTSLRGVARLTAQVAGGAPRLACAPSDGVEVLAGDELRWPWRLTGEIAIEPSSLDAGAVRLRWQDEDGPAEVLARTRLPIKVLRDAVRSSGELRLGIPCVIDDQRTLAMARVLVTGEQLEGGSARHVEVTLLRGKARNHLNRLVGEVHDGRHWWWHKAGWRHGAKAKCSIESRYLDPLPYEGELRVMAELRRARLGGRSELLMMAPVEYGEQVQVSQRISTNRLGIATSAEGLQVAVLAAQRPVEASERVEVMPIQHVPLPMLREALGCPRFDAASDKALAGLKRLPLLVPALPIFSLSQAPSVRRGAADDSDLREDHVDAIFFDAW